MFLKNRNIIFKIRRSKVTDNAALKALGPFEKLVFEIMSTRENIRLIARTFMNI